MAALPRIAGTLAACGLAYLTFERSAPLAGMIGLGEMHLLVRLGLVLLVLGAADALAGKLFAQPPHP